MCSAFKAKIYKKSLVFKLRIRSNILSPEEEQCISDLVQMANIYNG